MVALTDATVAVERRDRCRDVGSSALPAGPQRPVHAPPQGLGLGRCCRGPEVKGIPGTRRSASKRCSSTPTIDSVAYGMPGVCLGAGPGPVHRWHEDRGTRWTAPSSPHRPPSWSATPTTRTCCSPPATSSRSRTRRAMGAQTWSLFSPTVSGDELRMDPHDPDHMLLADEMTSLFESLDGGRTFSRVAQEFAAPRCSTSRSRTTGRHASTSPTWAWVSRASAWMAGST